MKFLATAAAALSASIFTINALNIPSDIKALSLRDTISPIAGFVDARGLSLYSDLEKRKGGGGRSSGGSGSSSSSGGGARSGSSNSGGRTTTGSGVSPSYGGGRYYGGGAAMPYRSGARSPLGITPFILPLAALSIFPGLWLYSVYAYPYTHPYSFYNTSANANQTKPVQCLCEEYSECGCDDNTDSEFVSSVVGSGAYAALDKTLVNVADVNGTSTIVLNGTLPNGTTASGGTTDGTSSAGIRNSALEHMGLWVMGAVVVYGVWFL